MIVIQYEFEIREEVEISGGYISPKSTIGIATETYNFQVSNGTSYFIDFMIQECVGESTFKSWSLEKQEGFKNAINRVVANNFVDDDYLQDRDDFMNWLKAYFYDEALEECKNEYEE